MFQTVPLSIIRIFSLYTQQWYMSYRFVDSLLASCRQTCMTCTIAVCTVKISRWWTEELSETCRVSFQNKFEKLVHLVGFIVRNLSRCTVTWTSRKELLNFICFLPVCTVTTAVKAIWKYCNCAFGCDSISCFQNSCITLVSFLS
jgi:hypothetical protein